MKVILANPRGFCAGVNMAIESLEKALEKFGSPLYVYHEIVHNRPVVERFSKRGVVFVDKIDDIPEGATVLYSAHGVSPTIRLESQKRNLLAIDATCPLVTKVHKEAVKFASEGYTIILIGHEGHDEVLGTMGEAPQNIVLVQDEESANKLELPKDTKVAFLTQTTLSVDEAQAIIDVLKKKFPTIVGPAKDDICYATQNRQEAVKEIVPEVDVVLVLGSQNSSNSMRLSELAITLGKPAYLIDSVKEIKSEWLINAQKVLITAGASAPEDVVEECVDWLRVNYNAQVENRIIREEHVQFPLPRELRVISNSTS
ncbi:MAG: 4-hydroxy-3-methylbut-2-enyl diphosphate reductase [Planctomycetota bacterium]|nr:4-hydroxy-3-methylbut-2-enyl diphosphate reductase [Planctomycetota bacterium]RLS60595.1 MAG: 4-hydroxy-3-methylbut-2-enyl diphosphate reductase [Planctomycetota bacterium]RLS85810.1 MAG: 4-hydroxy-3-methylbut-2-enyl diphosphate reductase [Planctomycetota bacterium]